MQMTRENINAIGHFHIVGVPGPHQPVTSEINHPNVIKALGQTGCSGYVGPEICPTEGPAEAARRTSGM